MSDTRILARAAAIGLALAVAAGAVHAKDQVIIDLVNEPATLDPHLQWNPDSYWVYRNVFDNVVTRDNAGQIVPQLATSWKRLSDTEIEFTFRSDVKFHDGTPLTMDDVVYSVKRITDPAFGSPQLGQFNKIIKAEATGANTVKLTTDGAYPALLAQLVKLSIVPKHVVEKVGKDEFNVKPVGSGPYRLETWQRGVQVTLSRNDAYWGDKGAFKTALFRGVPDAATRVANLLAGTSDLVVTLNSDLAQQVEKSGRAKVLTVQTERVAYFAMNSFKAPLNDVRMRLAIAHAIDKEGIVEGILMKYPRVVGELVSPFHFGWADGVDSIPYDVKKAKELVAQMGAAAKTPMELATAPVYDQRVVQAIQQMLADIGLNVQIKMTDMATWLQGQQSAQDVAPMLTFSRWSCACQDADGIMFPLLHSSSAWSRVKNDKIDQLLAAARSEPDEARRKGLYGDVHKLVREEVPVIPLYADAIIYGGAKQLKWTPTPNESMFLNRMGWSE
ncbi:MAG: peptide ABC transporter [Rhodospirillales bacterium]|nr:peptide ABC transporter [Rhodospirillales bacterium]